MTRITTKTMGMTMLFPRVIGVVTGIELSKNHIDLLMSEELEDNIANQMSKSRYLLEMPELAEVKKVIEECLQHYVENVIKPMEYTKFHITQSWLNIARKGEHHHYHAHGNSLISGCLYINADKDVDLIRFFRETQQDIQIMSTEYDIFNADTWDFPVGTGDLIFFSSRLPHAVPENKRDEKRVSLAFNVFADGILGARASSNELKIQMAGGKDEQQ